MLPATLSRRGRSRFEPFIEMGLAPAPAPAPAAPDADGAADGLASSRASDDCAAASPDVKSIAPARDGLRDSGSASEFCSAEVKFEVLRWGTGDADACRSMPLPR